MKITGKNQFAVRTSMTTFYLMVEMLIETQRDKSAFQPKNGTWDAVAPLWRYMELKNYPKLSKIIQVGI